MQLSRVYLKMQMRPRRPAGLADIGDDLASLDLLACGHADARAMCVQRGQPAAVVELDVVAIAAAPTVEGVGDGYGAVGGGQDRGAFGHSDVGAAVVAGLAGDRVGAVALRRGDRARHRQRPFGSSGNLSSCRSSVYFSEKSGQYPDSIYAGSEHPVYTFDPPWASYPAPQPGYTYVGSGHRYYDNSGSSRASEHGDHQEIHRNQRSPAERMCIGGESRMTEDKPISLRSQSVFAPYIKDFVQQKQSLGLKYNAAIRMSIYILCQ